MGKQIIAATAAAQKTKISCPSFETVKQEIERIMRDPRFDDIPLVLETVDADLWPFPTYGDLMFDDV